MTIDRLAAMVAKGFEDVRREMREGFASLRAVADGHTQTLAGHTQTLADHTQILADHSHRLDRIERKLDSTIERVDAHSVRIETLEKRTGLRP